MKDSLRQCSAWLHTWTGLITGWVLFFVFVTGTAGYVDDEITRWMQPERPLSSKVDRDDQRMLSMALERLQVVAPDAKSWTVTLPHYGFEPRGELGLSIAWESMPPVGDDFGVSGSEKLDPVTGAFQQEAEPRATAGGRGLYRMHYVLRYMPASTGAKIVGICTMLMLLAVVTGVITHKKIFTDFFTFRPGKGQRSWLDAHNVVSVMSLPFFLMITYSGLVFFAFHYLPAGRDVLYGSSDMQRQSYVDELHGSRPDYEAVTLPSVPVFELVQRVEADGRLGRVASLQIMHPKGKTPYIEVRRVGALGINYDDSNVQRFSAIDGASLPFDEGSNATLRTQNTLLALHEGNFANWGLRWLYFLSGLLGCAVIGTGLVMWTVKRRTQHQRHITKQGGDSFTARLNASGLRLVEVLNAGTLVGVPLGVAACFWANRLLPVSMMNRAAWELNALFLVWFMALLYACIRPLKQAWLELLYVTIAAYALIPLLNLFTTDKHLGVTVPSSDWGLAGVDLTMLALAAVFAYIAFKLRHKWQVVEIVAQATLKAEAPVAKPLSLVSASDVAAEAASKGRLHIEKPYTERGGQA
ncbi:PepSY-associated TM helix domain-containing protein [Paenalcaligenes sp. Me131]|uniref:PepSY-associated TM helix domain-containing protein n=1 Tax=Paenalcaligenes sp. Me131 TaxID=3392636 RepID=UPI003D2C80E4